MSDNPILAALARLETGQADLGTRLAKLETGQQSLRTDFLGELGKARADIMERLDRLQHRMDGLDEHLTLGLGNSDRVERQTDGIAEQNRLLGEQMMSMQKLLRQLEGRINALEERK